MTPPRIRLCLAASGGGHLRQLLDLKAFWDQHDFVIVTEPTPLGHSLASTLPVRFLPHFAFGQRRTGSWWALLRAGLTNLLKSWRLARELRPQMILSTGAGSTLFLVLIAKLMGARFVLVESFARVKAPSLFARLARPFADKTYVQSPELLDFWPDAELCDPLVRLGSRAGEKEDLALVTVGTVMPFDRLVSAVAALDPGKGRPSRIIAQVGAGGAAPPGLEVHERMGFQEISEILDRADLVFCHGGTGSLVTALRAGCRIVAMPRRADLGEHYDDHQREIVDAFAAHGLIQVAEDVAGLQPALNRALAAEPQRATTDHRALVRSLSVLAAEWFPAAKAQET